MSDTEDQTKSFLTPRARKLMKTKDALGAVARLSSFTDHQGAVFDIGVNKGTIARHLFKIFPNSDVHMFEPLHEEANALKERFAHFGERSIVNEVALGKKKGKSQFNIGESRGTSSMMSLNDTTAASFNWETKYSDTIEVNVQTVDGYCSSHGIDHVSCMKVDTQGAELLIVEGAKKALAAQSIDILMMEWWSMPHYDGGPTLIDLSNYVAKRGYILFEINTARRNHKTGQVRFGDVVFVSEKFHKDHIGV